MVFPSDGRNHHAGVRNEHQIVEYLNAHPPDFLGGVQFAHRGGTKHVSDIDVLDMSGNKLCGISVKRHLTGGTFDYINTSKLNEIVDDQHLMDRLREIRDTSNSVDTARGRMNVLFGSILTAMTSNQIKTILNRIHERSPEWLMIEDKGNITCFKHTEIHEFVGNNDVEYILKRSPRAYTSAQIWAVKNAVETDTNLRVRLVLNNGVNAFMNRKTSIPCLKIQQDNVSNLLRRATRVFRAW